MRRILAWMLVLCAIITLCACGSAAVVQNDELFVYRPAADISKVAGELLRREPVAIVSGKGHLELVIAAIREEPSDTETTHVLFGGVKITSYSKREKEIVVWLSKEYLELLAYDQTIINSCLTLSLCTVKGIENVSIYVGDQPHYLGLTANDVLLYDTETNPYERQARLYFLSEERRYLASEYRTLSVEKEADLERCAIEELLRGSYSETLGSPLPEGTQLIGIYTENGICTVNLSDEFIINMSDNLWEQRLAVLSVVNTLTSISGVTGATVLVSGQPLTQYGEYYLEEPLSRVEAAIGPVNSVRGEYEVEIYVENMDGTLCKLPRIVSSNEFLNVDEAIVSIMVSGETEPGFKSLFPDGSSYKSVVAQAGMCSIDFPESFFAGFESQDERARALSALERAVKEVAGVTIVRVLRDGKLYNERISGIQEVAG